MSGMQQIVVFALDEQRYGLPLSAVERIVRSVEVTTLPEAPETVLGVINVQGRIIPVINLRKRFRLPEREIDLSDRLIIAPVSKWTVALMVDAVHEVIARPEQEVIAVDKIFPGIEHIEGVIKLEDGMILINNLKKCLSIKELGVMDDLNKETQ